MRVHTKSSGSTANCHLQTSGLQHKSKYKVKTAVFSFYVTIILTLLFFLFVLRQVFLYVALAILELAM